MSQYLKSADPELDRLEIEEAFEVIFSCVGDAHFEHGSWFVYSPESDVWYSAHDAEPDDGITTVNGLCFEEL